MNGINLDFKRENNGYLWNIISLLFFALSLFSLGCSSSIIKSLEFYDLIIDDNTEETNDENNNNNAQAEEVIINYRSNQNLNSMNIIENLNGQEFKRVEENSKSVIFQCIEDQTVHYPVICKKTRNIVKWKIYYMSNILNIKIQIIFSYAMEIFKIDLKL